MIYFIIKFINKPKSKKKEYIQILQNINFQDSKKSAYTITKYIRYFITTDKNEELVDEIISLFEPYKYKKNTPSIPQDVQDKYIAKLKQLYTTL